MADCENSHLFCWLFHTLDFLKQKMNTVSFMNLLMMQNSKNDGKIWMKPFLDNIWLSARLLLQKLFYFTLR